MQLKIEIQMAKLEQIKDIITVCSECDTSVWIRNMKRRWIKYYGPSCVSKVQIPIPLPNGIAFLHMFTFQFCAVFGVDHLFGHSAVFGLLSCQGLASFLVADLFSGLVSLLDIISCFSFMPFQGASRQLVQGALVEVMKKKVVTCPILSRVHM